MTGLQRILAILLNTLAFAAAAQTHATAGAPTLSAEETRAILDQRKGDRGNRGAEAAWRDDCAIDLQAGTVTVTAKDREKLAEELARLDRDAEDDNKNYGKVQYFCGSLPKVQLDMSVVKDTPYDTRALPTDEVLEAVWQACGNPPNAANKRFMQKVKVIRFAVAPKLRKDDQYNFDFRD